MDIIPTLIIAGPPLFIASLSITYQIWRQREHRLYRPGHLSTLYARYFLGFYLAVEIVSFLLPSVEHGDYRLHLYWAAGMPVLVGHLLWRWKKRERADSEGPYSSSST